MDQSEDQIRKKLNKYHQFLKRTLHLVLSVSVFSFFVWYSSGFSIHPQSFNTYFSTCLFSMFTHTLERKYMFLICNGILAFIAKTSVITSSPPISAFDTNLSETNAPASDIVVVPLGSSESQENAPPVVEEQVLEQVIEQKECHEEVLEAAEEQEDHNTLYTETEGGENEYYNEEEGRTESGVGDDELEDTTITANEESVNTEELNKKFEEFIRKMKEEIRIEAQRQLIAV